MNLGSSVLPQLFTWEAGLEQTLKDVNLNVILCRIENNILKGLASPAP
jgi:hypothetical protein